MVAKVTWPSVALVMVSRFCRVIPPAAVEVKVVPETAPDEVTLPAFQTPVVMVPTLTREDKVVTPLWTRVPAVAGRTMAISPAVLEAAREV